MIYYPPQPGLRGHDPLHWYARRLPTSIEEAHAMASIANERLYDSVTQRPIDPQTLLPTSALPVTTTRQSPITIPITQGQIGPNWFNQNRKWLIPAIIGLVVLSAVR